jgi:hypothetical protein
MTEMEEIKTMLANMNKKLDKVIFQNKIIMNTEYGSLVKQKGKRDKDCINIIRYNAIKDFIYFVKCKEAGVYAPVIKTFVTSYERLLKLLEEFEFNEAHMQDL